MPYWCAMHGAWLYRSKIPLGLKQKPHTLSLTWVPVKGFSLSYHKGGPQSIIWFLYDGSLN